MKKKNLVIRCSSICMIIGLLFQNPYAAFAHRDFGGADGAAEQAAGGWRARTAPVQFGAGAAQTPIDLDLTSTTRNLSAELLGLTNSVNINLAGMTKTINPSDLLTAAELVAASQMMSNNSQTLRLGAQGQAVGGRVSLASDAMQSLNQLVVPQNVRLWGDFSSGAALNLSGNLTNAGKIFAYSSAPHSTSATINANNIYNQTGALLTTVLQPGSAGLGYVAKLDLSLNALGDIINAGTISSSGNLTASAGGSLVNALPQGMNGAMPLMQAANNVNLYAGSGNFTNAGNISALAGNINVNSASNMNMLFNNTNGTMNALAGNINFRDATYTEKTHMTLNGGDWHANDLNLWSGNGKVNVDGNDITSRVNIYAGEAHVWAATDNLKLGDMVITGDPTYYNTAGDVTISGDLVFSGVALAIVASQNILTDSGAGLISTASSSGNGGSITMIAGSSFTSDGPASADNDTTSTLYLSGASSTGGKIDLVTGGEITSFDSSSSATNGSGGIIQLFAMAGGNSDSGQISLPTGVTITSGGNGTGVNGDVIIAAGAEAGNQSISLGAIDTTGGMSGTGYVSVHSANALVYGTITNGVVAGGILTAYTYGLGLASVSTGSITTEGAYVKVLTGDYTASGNITTSSSTSYGGNVLITASSGVLNLGDIDTSTSAGGNCYAGTVNLANSTFGGTGGVTVGNIYANATGGGDAYGGHVLIQSLDGISGGSIDTSTDGNGSGGAVIVLTGMNATTGSLEVGQITTSGANGGLVELVNSSDTTEDVNLTVNGTITTDATALDGAAGPVALVASGAISATFDISAQATANVASTAALGGGVFISSGGTGANSISVGDIDTSATDNGVGDKAGTIILLSYQDTTSTMDPTNITHGTLTQTGGTAGSNLVYGLAGASVDPPSIVNITPTTDINISPGGYQFSAGDRNLAIDTGGDSQLVAPLNFASFSLGLKSLTQVNGNDNINIVMLWGTVDLLTDTAISSSSRTANVGIFSSLNLSHSLAVTSEASAFIGTAFSTIGAEDFYGTSNVTINAANDVVMPSDINVSSEGVTGTITVTAGHSILTQSIGTNSTNGTSGNIALRAGASIYFNNLTTYDTNGEAGDVVISAGESVLGGSLNTYDTNGNAGSVSITAGSSISVADIYAHSTNGDGGNVALAAGTSVRSSGINAYSSSFDAGSVSVSAGTSVSIGYITAGSTFAGTGPVNINAGGFIELGSVSASVSSGTPVAGHMSFVSGSYITVDYITSSAQTVSLVAQGNISTNNISNYQFGSGSGEVIMISLAGNITTGAISTLSNDPIDGSVSLVAAGNITSSSISTGGGNVFVSAGGSSGQVISLGDINTAGSSVGQVFLGANVAGVNGLQPTGNATIDFTLTGGATDAYLFYNSSSPSTITSNTTITVTQSQVDIYPGVYTSDIGSSGTPVELTLDLGNDSRTLVPIVTTGNAYLSAFIADNTIGGSLSYENNGYDILVATGGNTGLAMSGNFTSAPFSGGTAGGGMLASLGTGSITNTSGIVGTRSLRLHATGGDIGAPGNRVNTTAESLQATTVAYGSAYLHAIETVTLGASTAGMASGIWDLTGDEIVTLGGPIMAHDVSFQISGSMNIAQSILAGTTGSINLVIGGFANFSHTAILSGNGLGVSTNSAEPFDTRDIGSYAKPFTTYVSEIGISMLGQTGSVYINNPAALELAADLPGNLSVSSSTIETANDLITNGGMIKLSAFGNITTSDPYENITSNGGSIYLTSLAGSIGTFDISSASLTANGGNIVVYALGSVTVQASSDSLTGDAGNIIVLAGSSFSHSTLTASNVSAVGANGGLVQLVNSSATTDSTNLTVTGTLNTSANGVDGIAGPVALVSSGAIYTNDIDASSFNTSSVNAMAGSVFVSSGGTGATAINIDGQIDTHTRNGFNNKAGNIILLSSQPLVSVNDPTNITHGSFDQSGGGFATSSLVYGLAGASEELPAELNITPTADINIRPGGYQSFSTTALDLSIIGNGDRQMFVPINIAAGRGDVSLTLHSLSTSSTNDNIGLVLAGSLETTGIISLATASEVAATSIFTGGDLILGEQLSMVSGASMILQVLGDTGLGGGYDVSLNASRELFLGTAINNLDAALTLTAGGNVTVGNIGKLINNASDIISVTAGGSILAGSITTGQSSFWEVAQAVTMSAGGSINVGDIDSWSFGSNGGGVVLTAGGTIVTDHIFTHSSYYGVGNAGSITLSAGGAVTTSDLQSYSAYGHGGSVTVNSGGSISTGIVRAAGQTGGGSVTLTALGSVSTGYIWAYCDGYNGDGAPVTITAGSFIETGNIFTPSGATSGVGADITLTSGSTITVGILSTGNLNNNGIAGNIYAIATSDIVATSVSTSAGAVGGNVVLVSLTGNIASQQFQTTTSAVNGKSGSLSLTAGGNVTSTFIIYTYSDGNNGTAGNVFISAGGSSGTVISTGTLNTEGGAGGTDGQIFLGANVAGVNGFQSTGNATIDFTLSFGTPDAYLFYNSSSPSEITSNTTITVSSSLVDVYPGVYTSDIGSSGTPVAITLDMAGDSRTIVPIVTTTSAFISGLDGTNTVGGSQAYENNGYGVYLVAGGFDGIELSGNILSAPFAGGTASNALLSTLGPGGIAQQAPGTITANGVSLTTVSGNIGSLSVDVQVDTPYITIATAGGGDACVRSIGSTDLTLRAASAGLTSGNFHLVALSSINLTQPVVGSDISLGALNGGSVNVTQHLLAGMGGGIHLVATGQGSIADNAVLVSGYQLNITFGSGDVGSFASPLVTQASNVYIELQDGNAFLSVPDTVSLSSGATTSGHLYITTTGMHGDITSNTIVTSGGNVSLISQYGSVFVADVATAGLSSGNIFLSAPDGVTAGLLDAASESGANGGSVIVLTGNAFNRAVLNVSEINTSGANGGMVQLVNSAATYDSNNLIVNGPISTDADALNGAAGPVSLVASGGISVTSDISAQATANGSSTTALGGSVFISSGSTGPTAISVGNINTSATNNGAGDKAGNIILLSQQDVSSTTNPSNITHGTLTQSGGTAGTNLVYGLAGASETVPSVLNATPTTAINIRPGGYQQASAQAMNLSINTGGDTQMVVPINIGFGGTSLSLSSLSQASGKDNVSLVLAGNLVTTQPISIAGQSSTADVGIFTGGRITIGGQLSISSSAGIAITALDPAGLIGSSDVSMSAAKDVVMYGNIVTTNENGNSGSVVMSAGGNLFAGNITADAGTGGYGGGDIHLAAGSSLSTGYLCSAAQTFFNTNGGQITALAGSSLTTGWVNASTYSGVAGGVTMLAGTSIKTGSINSGLVYYFGSGEGASVNLVAGTSVSTDYIHANGGLYGGQVNVSAGTYIDTGEIWSGGEQNTMNYGSIVLTASEWIHTGSINDSSTTNPGGSITITAGNEIEVGTIYSRANDISLTAGGSITTLDVNTQRFNEDSGSVNMVSGGFISSGIIFTYAQNSTTRGGDVTMTATQGMLFDVIGTTGGISGGNIVLVSTEGDVRSLAGVSSFTTGSNGVSGSIAIAAAGTITANQVHTYATGSSGIAGNVFISSGGSGNAAVNLGSVDTSAGSGGVAGEIFLGANVAGTNGPQATGNANIVFDLDSGGAVSTPDAYLFYNGNPSSITSNTVLTVTSSQVTIYPGVYTSDIGSSGTPVSLDLDLGGDSRTIVPIVSTGNVYLTTFSGNNTIGGAEDYMNNGFNLYLASGSGSGISITGDVTTAPFFSGKGGDVTLIAVEQDGYANISTGQILTAGQGFVDGNGGNVTVQGDSLTLGNIDTRANGDDGNAGKVLLTGTNGISGQYINAFGGTDSGNGASIQAIAAVGAITIADFVDSSARGAGKAGNILLNAETDVTFRSLNAIGGDNETSTNHGGNITVISSTGSVLPAGAAPLYLDSSGSFHTLGVGSEPLADAGEITVIAPTVVDGTGSLTFRAEGANGGGNGGNITMASLGDVNVDFVSSSASSTGNVAPTATGNAGRVTISSLGSVHVLDVRSQGAFASGSGGNVTMNAFGGTLDFDLFVFANSVGTTGGGGSVALRAYQGVTGGAFSGNSITAFGGSSSGNSSSITVRSTTGAIDIAGVLNASVVNSGNAGAISLTAATGIQAGALSAAGGTSDGDGANITVSTADGDIVLSSFASSRAKGSGAGGDIILHAPNGEIAVLGVIGTGAAIAANGAGDDAGNITITYNSAESFVIDPSGSGITNGAKGHITAFATGGAGNGGIITINTLTQDETIELLGTIDATSEFATPGRIVLAAPSGSAMSVIGSSTGELLGPLDVSGASIAITLTKSDTTFTVGNISASGLISIDVDDGNATIALNSDSTILSSTANVFLRTDNLLNDGSITTLSGSVLVESTGDLNIGGTGSMAGTNPAAAVDIYTTSASGVITFLSDTNMELNGGEGPLITSNFVEFAGHVDLSTTNSTCFLCSGFEFDALPGGNLSVSLTGNTTVTINATFGGVMFYAPDGDLTLDSNGGFGTLRTTNPDTGIWIQSDTGNITVESDVIVNSAAWMSTDVYGTNPLIDIQGDLITGDTTDFSMSFGSWGGADLNLTASGLLQSAGGINLVALGGGSSASVSANVASVTGTIRGEADGAWYFESSSGQVVTGVITANNGSATVVANGDIHVTSDITATEGNITLQDLNDITGAINIDPNITLTATTTGAILGRVYIFLGASYSQTNTTAPANVVVNNTNGGTTYFGATSISASAPNNTMNSDGSEIVFDAASLGPGAITLGGNVTINATAVGGGGGGPIVSLDLTDMSVTSLLLSLQLSSDIGGTLIVEGGVAVGGNVIIGPAMLATSLTAENIPANVTVTLQGFGIGSPVNITITGASTTTQVIIAGTHEFTGGSSSGILNISSNQAGPALVIEATGLLSSDGTLDVTSNGSIALAGNVTATTSVELSVTSVSTITRTAGTITAPSVTLTSNTGSIGTGANPISTTASTLALSTTGSANAFVNNIGTVNLAASSVGGLLQLLNNNSITTTGVITAGSLKLQTTASNGNITIGTNVTATSASTLTTHGTGIVTINSARTLATTNGNVNIISNGIDIQGAINSGTRSTQLRPNAAIAITVGNTGASSDPFEVSATELSRITAGTLVVGDFGKNSTFTLAGDIDVSGAGPAGVYNLVFVTGGSYSPGSSTIDLGTTHSLSVSTQGNLTSGSVSGATFVNFSSAQTVTMSGSVSVPGGTILVTGATLNVTGTINAGSGQVQFAPYGNRTIALGGTGGNAQFELTNAFLANVTANEVVLGQAFTPGGITVIDGTDLSATNVSQYSLQNGGNITNAGNLTLGLKMLTMNAQGTVTSGSIFGGSFINLQAQGALTVNGTIAMTAGTLNLQGSTLTFSGATVSIGQGIVYIRPTSDVSIGIGGTGGSAAFKVTDSMLSDITSAALAIGDLGLTGGLTVEGDLDISSSFNLYLLNGGAISTTGQTVTVGSRSFGIQSGSTVNTGTVTAAGGQITLLAGNTLTVDGAITNSGLGSTTLGTTTGSNGNIVLDDSVGGGAFTTIALNGSGSLTQSTGTISGTNVVLSSGTGSLGTSSAALAVTATTLRANTAGSGTVFVDATSSALTLGASSAGGDFSVTSSGALTVGDISTLNGDITLVANSGALNVQAGKTIFANEGNLVLQNTDTASGTIYIGANSELEAFTISNPVKGFVTIFIGTTTPTPTNTTAPANVEVNSVGSGTAYFGANSILAMAGSGDNIVNVIDRDVVFDTGTRPAAAITLAGDNIITADPPVQPTVTVQSGGSASDALNMTSGVNLTPTSGVTALSGPTGGTVVLVSDTANTSVNSASTGGSAISITTAGGLPADSGNTITISSSGSSSSGNLFVSSDTANASIVAIGSTSLTTVGGVSAASGGSIDLSNSNSLLVAASQTTTGGRQGRNNSSTASSTTTTATTGGRNGRNTDASTTTSTTAATAVTTTGGRNGRNSSASTETSTTPTTTTGGRNARTNNTTTTGSSPLSSPTTNTGSATGRKAKQSNLPVAFTPITATSGMQMMNIGTALIEYTAQAQIQASEIGVVSLNSGEALVMASEDTTLNILEHQILVKAGTIALISHEDGVTKVRNLYEQSAGSNGLQALVANQTIGASAGTEIVVSPDSEMLLNSIKKDSVGRRLLRSADAGNLKVATCEISLVSLTPSTDLLPAIFHSKHKIDRAIAEKLIKMAACLSSATAGHGAYTPVTGQYLP